MFRFVVGAAVICSVAALRVDAVGRLLSDPPVSHAAYVAQAAAGANAGAGQAMYAKAGCENCHGPNGQGTAAGPRIAGTARQLPAFVAYIRKPTGTMPPQSAQVVSDQALADIFAFLRSSPVGRVLPDPPGARSRRTRPTRTHPLRPDAPTPAPRCTRRSAATSVTRTRRRVGKRGRASGPTRSPSPVSPNTCGSNGRDAAVYREGVVEPGTGRYLCVRADAAPAAGSEFDSAAGTVGVKSQAPQAPRHPRHPRSSSISERQT